MKKIFIHSLFTFTFSLLTVLCSAQTGTWTAVHDTAPHYNLGGCLLMVDGSVICHNDQGDAYGSGWDRLTPDASGSYVNGKWDTIPSMKYGRLFFSTQVLPNGNVYVAGGEYGAGDTAGEVYNFATQTWKPCGGIPAGWNIYDGNSELLYNGNVLEGPQIGNFPSYDCLLYNPTTNAYSVAPTAFYNHDEASWLKLRDSSVLFVGIGSRNSNRYIPKYNKWVDDGIVPGDLYDPFGYEAGPAFLLPNGKALFTGATGFNALYTPSGDTTPGTWSVADSFPIINGHCMGTPDASGAMMVNGHILLSVSPIGVSNNEFLAPAYFVEYDYTTDKFTQVTSIIPGYNTDSIPWIGAFQTQMLDLPDGNILVSVSQTYQSKQYYIYTPGSAPIPQGKPTIDNLTNIACNKYRITGKLFNGISEGAGFGDDWQMATDYPVVRLTDGINTYYATTTNWNRIGAVMTDSLEDTAYFVMPSLPGGTYSVVVTANGFASNPVLLNTFGVSITSHTDLGSCNTGTGSATALAADGVAPYNYLWSPSGGTNASASNLSGGTYTITVTDITGCSVTASVVISQAAPLTVYPTVSYVNCNGGSDGSVKAWVNGGTQPYTYLWNPGGNTNAFMSGLSAGIYTVNVADSCGNTASTSVEVKQPDPLAIAIDSVIPVSCHGNYDGKILTNTTGGTQPYTYSWTGGAGNKDSASVLSVGTYTITVSDACGKSATAQATITQPNAIVNTTIVFNEIPGQGCDGEAVIIPSGGTPPYTYFWIGGGQTTDTIKNHCAGSFCCKVTDNHGCVQVTCVDIISDVQSISSGTDEITVYPNPNNGTFTVSSALADQTMEIYNVLGEKVYSQFLIPNSQFLINLSQPNGIYFYRVYKTGGAILGQGKIIIQK